MWRRLRRGELDHEALWLGVSLAAFVMAWVWVRLGLQSPACVFHEVTGWACPGCGATRCVRYALRGAFHAAFLVNPLMCATLAGVVSAPSDVTGVPCFLRASVGRNVWRPSGT